MKFKSQKGAAAVEFAIILPVLVLLIFGAIEFGLFLYNQQIITNASREGARAGIVSRAPRVSNAEISSVVQNYSAGNLVTFGAPNVPAVNIQPPDRTGSTFGDDLTVTVTYNYDFFVLSNLGFEPITMAARTVMKME